MKVSFSSLSQSHQLFLILINLCSIRSLKNCKWLNSDNSGIFLFSFKTWRQGRRGKRNPQTALPTDSLLLIKRSQEKNVLILL